MAPKHAFLFDIPVRYVLGAGITTGVLWTFLRPKDVALAQEPEKKPKVLVRTASGAVISCNQTVGAPARRARRRAASVSQSQQTHPRVLARRRFRRALRAQSARWTMPSVWAWPSRPARFTLDEVR